MKPPTKTETEYAELPIGVARPGDHLFEYSDEAKGELTSKSYQDVLLIVTWSKRDSSWHWKVKSLKTKRIVKSDRKTHFDSSVDAARACETWVKDQNIPIRPLWRTDSVAG